MFTVQLPKGNPKVLAVKLTAKGERSVRKKHPWIFSDSIIKINKEGVAGDIAVIFNNQTNKAIGVGLYDPDSPITIKMVHFNGGATINDHFFKQKIKNAYALRLPLLATQTNSYRLLFGENDGFPGLVADVYAAVLVVKIYNAIWFPYLQKILAIIQETTNCETIVLRLSRNLTKNNPFNLSDGAVVYGKLASEKVIFIEHGIRFSANVIKGHKTGYFLDHRDNRRRVGEFSKGKTVLDVFSYAGGFSVHALANGATAVTSLDISAQALEVAKQNGKLNPYTGKHTIIVGDAFKELEDLIAQKKVFNIVVIDPPSFAKQQKEVTLAQKKYSQLAHLGAQLTAPKGILVLASCSSRVVAADFFKINRTTLAKQSYQFKEILTTTHDIDHPITFPEGAYLKCGYYQKIQ